MEERTTQVRALTRLVLLSLVAWSVPAVLESTQSVVGAPQTGAHASWLEAWLRYGPKYYFWALLTPIVWLIARRFPLHERAGRARALLVHALANIVLSALHLVLMALYYHGFWNNDGETLGSVMRWYFSNVFAFELLAYPIVLLVYHLVHYQRTVREQELTAARLETSLAQARFDALQSRLHPHFLFNALNALIGLLRYDRSAEAVRAIGELGHLLRDALDDTQGQERSLEEELEWAERYLGIEQLRIGSRLRITIDVEDDVLDAAVPRLLLQPLLENAIRHGIAPSAEAGDVRIVATRTGGSLHIEVLDDGGGPSASDQGNGVGLSNTRARLQHLYGARHALTLERRRPRGARVSVVLPLRMHVSDTGKREAVSGLPSSA